MPSDERGYAASMIPRFNASRAGTCALYALDNGQSLRRPEHPSRPYLAMHL